MKEEWKDINGLCKGFIRDESYEDEYMYDEESKSCKMHVK